ncbi:MAG: TonB-dependent receptor domain-containing protein [Gemmatimonadaceae bacterium]
MSSLFSTPAQIAFALCIACSSALAQGSIAGRITLPDDRTPVPGAIVRVVGTTLGALADSTGGFMLTPVPAGSYSIEASAPGHTLECREVLVRDGDTLHVALRLAAAPRELAGITVLGGAADALERVPGSATAISQRKIDAIQPISANDVLRTVPGVHIQDEEGAGLRANIGIRGLDPDRSRTVLVLEDGTPVALAPYGEPEMYYSPPIDRMSRVEVIKGSGSILFGPQTIGGVVNYVTAEPTSDLAGRVDVRGGSGGQQLTKLMIGGTNGNARGILSAFRRTADDFNGLSFDVRDATAKVGARTAFGDLSAKLSVYEENSNATYVGLTDSMFRADPRRHPMPNDRLDMSRQALTLSHESGLGRGTIRTTAYGYSTTRNWMRRNYTYSATGNSLVPANASGGRDRSFDVAGIEPRFRAVWSAGHVVSDLDIGARYHVERARDQFVNGTVDGARTDIRDDENRTGHAVSAFVQNRFALSPTFDITPGLRVERFRYERRITRTRVRRNNGSTTTRLPEDVDIRSGDAVGEIIPGIGATWRPQQMVTVFAGAHRGFAPPRTKDALIFADPVLAADQQVPDPVSLQLDAERSWNYEFGTRLAPAAWISLEATAFMLDFTNQIIEPSLSAGSTTAAALANQGATRHEGVELGGVIDLGKLAGRARSVTLEGNWTFSNAIFSRDRFLTTGTDTVNVRGNTVPYAPRNRAHAALSVELPAGIRVRFDGTFVGAQFSDNFETRTGSANGRVGEIPAFRVYDAALQYEIPGLAGVRLTGAVKNIAGTTYIASRRPEGIKVGLPRLASLGFSWGF